MITKSEGFGNCGNKVFTNFGENAFDKVHQRGNYRIANIKYNTTTNELTIEQYPDVTKTVVIGNIKDTKNSNTSHKDVIEKIVSIEDILLNGKDFLDKEKYYIVYNQSNSSEERYMYYSYSTVIKDWISTTLVNGDEFFNLEDSIKYRYLDDKLSNVIDVDLSLSEKYSEEGSIEGLHLSPSPSTKEGVIIPVASDSSIGLMSSSDKLKLDNIENTIGAILDIGDSSDGKFPLYLKDINGNILSSVLLDQDDYVKDITIRDATQDDISDDIEVGDKIMVVTITNGSKLKIPLKHIYTHFEGADTPSISTTISESGEVSSDIILDSKGSNLTSITSNGLLTELLWDSESTPVNFIKGLKDDYSEYIHKGYVYITTDTKEIIIDGNTYGLNLKDENLKLIQSIEENENRDLLVTFSNGKTTVVPLSLVNETNKGQISSESYTKLNGIQTGAQVNLIERIKVNGTVLPIDTLKTVNLNLDDFITLPDTITEEERYKLTQITEYVSEISGFDGLKEARDLLITYFSPGDKSSRVETITLNLASESESGLITPDQYNLLSTLSDIDPTGTVSPTWQLSKENDGPKIKNSNGQFELRNSTDDTYADLTVKNLTIVGDVTQEGESFITNAETVTVADNTITLNNGEPGAGVTKGYAGLEIDRGTLDPYMIVFDESDDRFKAGVGTNLWPIMLRDNESDLSHEGVLIWDATNKRAKTANTDLDDYVAKSGDIMTGDLIINKNNGKGTIIQDGEITLASQGSVKLTNSNSSYEISHYDNSSTYIGKTSFGSYISSLHSGCILGVDKLSISNNSGDIYLNTTKSSDGNSLESILLGTSSIQLFITKSLPSLLRNDPNTGTSYKIWDEGNDGHESGLDADTLDGKHASEFLTETSLDNYVTLDTDQTVSGTKTFSNGVTFDSSRDAFIKYNGSSDSLYSTCRSTIGKLLVSRYLNPRLNLADGDAYIEGALTVVKEVTGKAGFFDTSDRRLKSNIKDIDLKSNKIKLYEFDKDGRHSYGVIAQELEELYPSVVGVGPDGYKTVNYSEVLTIKCAELEKENKELKERLDRLENLLSNK